MAKKIDLTGKKFGRWYVIKCIKKIHDYHEFIWKCRCECGVIKNVRGTSLKTGRSKSCGCFSIELTTTHGMEGTPTYNTWAHMLYRCRNPKAKWYHRYGGRGIKVCKEWEQFENFFSDMGEKPESMTLDRIDNDNNYEKSNCRWTTIKEQVRNRANSPKYEVNGEIKSLAALAEEYKIPIRRLYQRMRNEWNIEEALKIKKANPWHRR